MYGMQFYLDGNISSSLRSDIAEDQVLGVPGLLEIKNNLVSDDHLAGDLAMALGRYRGPMTSLSALSTAGCGTSRWRGSYTPTEGCCRGNSGKFPVESAPSSTNWWWTPTLNIIRVMAPVKGGEAEDKVGWKYVRHTK